MNVTLKKIAAVEKLLKPCPFCGQNVEIGICDREGNFKGPEYIDDPYSGTMFIITHKKNEDCILHCDPRNWEHVGTFLFEDVCELMKIWNRRTEGGAS